MNLKCTLYCYPFRLATACWTTPALPPDRPTAQAAPRCPQPPPPPRPRPLSHETRLGHRVATTPVATAAAAKEVMAIFSVLKAVKVKLN